MKQKYATLLFVSVLAGAVMVVGCGAKAEQTNTNQTNASSQAVFQFGMSGLYKPFNFKENGELQGFDVDIGKALAEKMHMKAEPVTNPWETIIQGLLAKKYDAIIGSMQITAEREKVVDFTEPYYRSGSQIFVAANNTTIHSADDLKGKRIGVLKASTYKALALKYTDKDKIVDYDSDITALTDLPSGRLDAVITDQMVGLRMIKEGANKIKDVGTPITHDQHAIAVRKDDKQLTDKLNQALHEMEKDGTYDAISNKWFGRNILGAQQ